MKDTEGWQQVEQHIKERIGDNKNRLMTCSLEDVPKHRERATALESVLLYVEDVIEKGMEMMREQPP